MLAIACAISSVALRRGAKTRIGASPAWSALAIIPRPEFSNLEEADFGESAQIDLVLRDRPLIVPNEKRVASDPAQPFDHVLRIVHTPAEQKQLRLRRGESEGQLVVHAPDRIGDELIFIDDEQARTLPPEKTGALRLEGGDNNLGVEV